MKFDASLIVFLATLCTFSSLAEEGSHLEPVEGYFSSFAHSHVHLSAVRDILVRDAVDSPAAMVTVPSFESENIVFLLSKKGTMFVVSATASKQIYSSKKKNEIKVIRKEKAINAGLTEQISAVFTLATAQTRYPNDKIIGFDGETYYFSAFTVGIGIRAGQIWSPASNTTAGKLVTLGEHLHGYAKGSVSEEALRAETQALLTILRKNSAGYPASGQPKDDLKSSTRGASPNDRRISVAQVDSIKLEVEQPSLENNLQIRVHDFVARNHGKTSVSCDVFYVADGIKEHKIESVVLKQESRTSEIYAGELSTAQRFTHGTIAKVVYNESTRLPLFTWYVFYYH